MSWNGGGQERKKGKMVGFMLTNQAWKQSLIDHHKRMGGIKPTIRFDKTPWSHSTSVYNSTLQPSKPAAGRGGNSGRPGTAGQSPRSARGGSKTQQAHSSQQRQPGGRVVAMAQEEGFGIHCLTPEQRETCTAMMSLLVSLENQGQSKKIVEEIFVSAEEARLLQGYTGVLPGMEHADRGEEYAASENEEVDGDEDETETESERQERYQKEDREAEKKEEERRKKKKREEERRRQRQEREDEEEEKSRGEKKKREKKEADDDKKETNEEAGEEESSQRVNKNSSEQKAGGEEGRSEDAAAPPQATTDSTTPSSESKHKQSKATGKKEDTPPSQNYDEDFEQ